MSSNRLSASIQVDEASETAEGGRRFARRWPTWADASWLLDRMLTRRADVLLLFDAGRCVYASEDSGLLWGGAEFLEHLRIQDLFTDTPLMSDLPGSLQHWFRRLLPGNDGQTVETECWLEPIPGDASQKHALMLKLPGRKARKPAASEARSHYDLANVILITLDPAGRLRSINPKGLALLGYTEPEVVGKSWFDEFVPGDNRETLRKGFFEVVGGVREPRDYVESRIVKRSGETALIAWSCRTQKDRGGGVVSVLCSGLDITRQRRTENELQFTQQRFHDYAAASSDYFWEMDRDLRFSWFSERFTGVTGVLPEDLLGKTREETGIPDVDQDVWAEHLDDLANHRPFRDFIHPRTKPDGRVVWLSINGRPVFDDDGVFCGYRGTGTDITELVEADRAYKESEEKYRKIFEAETAAITVFDAETFKLIDANEAALELYGYTREEFLGLTVAEISAEPDATRDTVTRITKGALKYVPRRLKRRKDGSIFPAELTSSVFTHKGRTMICCVARDLTAEERQERALRESEQRFRSFAENSSAEIFIKDREGRYLLVNRNMTDLAGVTEEQALGRTAADFYSPEIAAQVEAHEREVLETEKTIVKEMNEDWPNGRRTFLSVRFPMFDALGRVIGVGGLNQEISELGEAKRALRASEQRFRDFAECAADYFWETDTEDRFIYLSENFQRVRGLAPEDALGKTRREAFNEEIEVGSGDSELHGAIEARRPFKVQISRRHPDGSTIRLESTGKPIFDRAGRFCGYRGTTRDITDAHVLSKELTYQATHDPLTGLLNRRAFEQRLTQALENARTDGGEHVLCYLDLDQFKVINDTCGHDAGDELLRELCIQLKATVRKRDTLARLGGDEFGVLMEHCALDQADRGADALRETITSFRFNWDGKEFRIGASIGLAPVTEKTQSAAAALSAADTACYIAKDQGRNRVHVSRDDDLELSRRYVEMEWVSRINAAIAEDRLQLLYQPIVPMESKSRGGHHYELLLRMLDEEGKTILPSEFLPAAERYNLSSTLDRWVVGTAIRWLGQHPEHLGNLDLCGINLSGHSLTDRSFFSFLTKVLDDERVPASKLCFEITETAAIANVEAATSFIEGIKQRGARFALDDFGSGLSSFAYLKALPVDYLKIDGVFVKDLENNALDVSMVKSINEIGHVMGKKTIAEFVENAAILEVLRNIGVDYGQGNALGRPAPLDRLA